MLFFTFSRHAAENDPLSVFHVGHVMSSLDHKLSELGRISSLTLPKPPSCISEHKVKIYIWVIDQACSVKMAGYWPSSSFCVRLGPQTRTKKNLANIQQSCARDGSILPTGVANNSTGFSSRS